MRKTEWASTWTAVKPHCTVQQGRPFGSLPLPPAGRVTFAKSAKLSEANWQTGIHAFHKYLLGPHYVPGPGILFLPFPMVLRRRETDSNASRAQAGNRYEEVEKTWGAHAWF